MRYIKKFDLQNNIIRLYDYYTGALIIERPMGTEEAVRFLKD
jgi:hypothetical protein